MQTKSPGRRRTAVIAFKVTPEDKIGLQLAALRDGRTVGGLVAILIRNFLERIPRTKLEAKRMKV